MQQWDAAEVVLQDEPDEELQVAAEGEDAQPVNLSQQQLAQAMRHNPRILKNFNTWLVGGNYSQRRLLNARPPPLPRSASSEKIKNKIGELRANLMKQSRRAKVDASGRAHRQLNLQRRIAAAGEKSESVKAEIPQTARGKSAEKRKDSPGRPSTAPRPGSPRIASAGLPPDLHPRQELKSSLVSHASRSHYCSMFPPLFSPYDRAAGTRMMRGWGSGVQDYYKGMASVDALGSEMEGASPRVAGSPQKAAVVDVQVPKPSPVKRPRLLSGQPGFYPTGTTVNALRHFTNYRLAVESEQEMRTAATISKKPAGAAGSAAAGGKPLGQMLRAQRSRTGGPTRSEAPASAGPSGGLWPSQGAVTPPAATPPAKINVQRAPVDAGFADESAARGPRHQPGDPGAAPGGPAAPRGPDSVD